MNRQALSAGSYRFRRTFHRRWRGLLSLALLIGLVGGVAMGALAAARRTQSSFAVYLASTNPSDLGVSIFGGANNGGGSVDLSASSIRAISLLPGVRHVAAAAPLIAVPLHPDGSPRLDAVTLVSTLPLASVNGLFFAQDRLAVIKGRMADPTRADEIVIEATAARLLGFHVGQVIPYGIYTPAQESQPGFGTPRVAPYRRITTKVVGIVQRSSGIVQDDIDRVPAFIFFTPALGQSIVADGGQGVAGAATYTLQLSHGNADVPAVERDFVSLVPPGTTYDFHAVSPVVAKVNRTVKPLTIALGVFGAVAALAAILIGLQVISRQLREDDDGRTILRALGAGPWATVADGLIGLLGAIVAGTLLATVVVVALSPLSPLGPVRPVFPGSSIDADWTVLGIGTATLSLGLGAITLMLAYRGAPHRVARRAQLSQLKRSKALDTIAMSGLPTSAVVGVRFALSAGRGRTAVPVRSALLGTALAVGLVVATLTFGSGLQTLVSHPGLYGWNWTYAIVPNSNVPPQALARLERDRDVARWTGYDYNEARIDGQTVPFLFEYDHPGVAPPILTGHEVTRTNQIVLGSATMAQLHKHLGDTVMVSYGAPQTAPIYIPPFPLVIVGTATMPAVGYASVVSDHTSMGTGALIDYAATPAAFRQAQLSPDPTLNGPNLVFVRLRSTVDPATGLVGLQRVADVANRAFAAVPNGGGTGDDVTVVGVQRPAEIVNYRSMGAGPAVLVSALAAGATLALGLTLAASVRRRRRDLALLKTLGFTQRQLAAAVACQASVITAIGIVIGVPLGVAVGRWLWTLFARQIYAVPQPTVPGVSLILVVSAAVVLANAVAALPGRSAARTSTAVLLRAE